ncbi:MAG: bifunctional 2-polyprenyl-6-hydroxyphenol methylase/3-demethylubiquinol 3-O-methyltransferase UbiG [Gammaproteobacteria bacterium]|nr:MAG: bifunctional 2-polyprenyl-6-hydroxyphenol methylase/3-demethylubiquinol 3-O-methyltransferase UbiG [Gammaproteobacteria bacterium]
MTDGQPASVDPEEVAFYTRLADRWWDTDGPFWPLHVLNRLRSQWILERINTEGDTESPLRSVRVLDIGCGGGLLAEAMARGGARVTGIDVTERNITVARLHAERAGLEIDYRYQSAEALAAAGERFDVVLNMEVVEHVADLGGFMAAACDLVAPSGHMFVATLNRTLAGFVIGIVGAEYVTGLLPRGTHQWSRFVRPDELSAHLGGGGLRVVDRSGVQVNPWRRRMALTPWLGVNYMVHARRVT